MHGPKFDPLLGQRLVVESNQHPTDLEEETTFTRSLDLPAGRRFALGAVAAAVVAIPTFVTADANSGGGDRRGRRGRRGKKGKRGAQGPQGPGGVGDSTVENGNLAALPVVSTIGDQATSVATCDSGSVLLGCGFEVSTTGAGTTPAGALNNTIPDVVPDANALTCTATLTRTDLISGSITAAARIQAYAICSA